MYRDAYSNSIHPVKVQVYERDWPDWMMISNITDYSPPVNQSDLSAEPCINNYFYFGVLSGNGQVLVTIKIITDLKYGDYDTMAITTYKWNSIIRSWDVMDDKEGLLSKTQENRFARFEIEKCFALSDDGTVLGVCSKLSIAVYSWNSDKSSWIPREVVFDLNNLSTTLTG